MASQTDSAALVISIMSDVGVSIVTEHSFRIVEGLHGNRLASNLVHRVCWRMRRKSRPPEY